MTLNVTEIVRKAMGWCPNAAMLSKKEAKNIEYFFVFRTRYLFNQHDGIIFNKFIIYHRHFHRNYFDSISYY